MHFVIGFACMGLGIVIMAVCENMKGNTTPARTAAVLLLILGMAVAGAGSEYICPTNGDCFNHGRY